MKADKLDLREFFNMLNQSVTSKHFAGTHLMDFKDYSHFAVQIAEYLTTLTDENLVICFTNGVGVYPNKRPYSKDTVTVQDILSNKIVKLKQYTLDDYMK